MKKACALSEKRASKILFSLVMSSLLIAAMAMSVLLVQAATISEVGTMTSARGWLFSQTTLSGIYYGFGWGDGYSIPSDLYFYNFLTNTTSSVSFSNDKGEKTPAVWGYSLYSAMIGDKIYIANFYPPYDPSKEWTQDANGLYVIDTKTNKFYLYDRLPFDFFVDDWPSPMVAVGTDLYFFLGIPGREDIARRVYKYTPSTKAVTALAELPKDSDSELGLGTGGIVYPVGNNIYITTYYFSSSGYPVYDNSIYVYDTLTDKFTYLATDALIPSNNYRANSVINGKLYFVGGDDPLTDAPRDKIVEYDPSTNQFSVLDTLKDAESKSYALAGASTTSLGGSLYVVGGEKVQSPGVITDSIIKIDIFDPIAEIAKSCPANGSYKNHGEYVSCVSKKAEEFLNSGMITSSQKDEIVSNAAKSSVGKKKSGR